MSLRLILLAGVALTALSGVASANDTYRCGDSICYDDQADETRRLNEMQLENPGAGADAVPGDDDTYGPADDDQQDDDQADDQDGQGGPYYPVEPDDGDDSAYPPADVPDTYSDDDDAYPDGDAPSDDGYDDDDMPYPNEDDD
jgi:hypothetical protein